MCQTNDKIRKKKYLYLYICISIYICSGSYMVDSVPELVKRICSIPKRRQITSAACLPSGLGAVYNVPISRFAFRVSTTCGFKWPTSMEPKPIDRSSTSRPSTSRIQAPLAETMEMG